MVKAIEYTIHLTGGNINLINSNELFDLLKEKISMKLFINPIII